MIHFLCILARWKHEKKREKTRAHGKRKIISVLATPLFACRNYNHEAERKKWRPKFVSTPSEKKRATQKNLSTEHFCFPISFYQSLGKRRKKTYTLHTVYISTIMWDEAASTGFFCAHWLRFFAGFFVLVCCCCRWQTVVSLLKSWRDAIAWSNNRKQRRRKKNNEIVAKTKAFFFHIGIINNCWRVFQMTNSVIQSMMCTDRPTHRERDIHPTNIFGCTCAPKSHSDHPFA